MATLLVDAETRRRLETVERSLVREFDDLPARVVEDEVADMSGEFLRQARIVDYVPLLTFRLARDRLLGHRVSLAGEPAVSDVAEVEAA